MYDLSLVVNQILNKFWKVLLKIYHETKIIIEKHETKIIIEKHNIFTADVAILMTRSET